MKETMKIKQALFLTLSLLVLATVQDSMAGASRAAAGDMNQDGLDDIILSTGDAFFVALSVGNGTFRQGTWIALDSDQPIQTEFIDLAGDGKQFPITGLADLGGFQVNVNPTRPSRYYGYGAELERFETMTQLGLPAYLYASFAATQSGIYFEYDPSSKQFIPRNTLSYSSPAIDLSLEKLTGGTKNQLAVLFENRLNLYEPDSMGGFVPLVEYPLTTNRTNIVTGSITGNPVHDMILWSPDAANITVFQWMSAYNWASSSIPLAETVNTLAVGDVDHDGFADVPSLNAGKDKIIFHYNNGLSFVPTSHLLPVPFGEEDEIVVLCGTFSSSQNGFVVVSPDRSEGPMILFFPVTSGAITTPIVSLISSPPDDLNASVYANVTVRDTADPSLIYWSETVPGWTTGFSLLGNNLDIQREEDTGSGYSPVGNILIKNVKNPLWPTLFDILTNQDSDEMSLFHLNTPLPVSLLPLRIEPTQGTYYSTIQAQFSTREGATIHYRKNGGTWQIYEPGTSLIYFHRDGTLDAYADYDIYTSPIETAIYRIDQPYDADSDFDGTPDFVEDAYGLNPVDGNPDTDHDGWGDLDELIRESDPSDADSVPYDLDLDEDHNVVGDGWSDFDEAFRQTGSLDPDSKPTVNGLEIPEAILPIAVAEVALATPTGSQGSRIAAKLLTGMEIASATLDSALTLRVPVDRPLVVGYTDKGDSEISLLAYVPRKDVDLHIEGDESTTVEDWIEAYAVALQSQLFEIRSTIQIDAESTATVLALELYMEQALSLSAPHIIWSGSGTLSQSQIDQLEQSVDLDEAAETLAAHISETSLPTLVRTYISWAATNDIRGNIIDRLAWVLHGWEPDEGDSPDSTPAKTVRMRSMQNPSAIDISSILSELDELFESIAKREISLEGTISWNGLGFSTLIEDGITYGLDSEGASLPVGANVKLSGTIVTPSPYTGVVWVKISALQILVDPTVDINTDSNGNGLPDQWENFYFPSDSPVSPTDDADRDGYTNLQEYNGFSDPTDQSSLPLASTDIMNWSMYD